MEVAVAVLLFFVAATAAAIKLGLGGATRAAIGLVAPLVVLLGIQTTTDSEMAGVAALAVVIAFTVLACAFQIAAWLR